MRSERRVISLTGVPMQNLFDGGKTNRGFSGAMRPKLVGLLDSVGINRWLGIASCNELFGSSSHLVQTASVLRYPVFIDGDNYNGTPKITKHPLLCEQLMSNFGEDVKALPNAIFLPLGDR